MGCQDQKTEQLRFGDLCKFHGGQVFFTNRYVLPLWKELSAIFP